MPLLFSGSKGKICKKYCFKIIAAGQFKGTTKGKNHPMFKFFDIALCKSHHSRRSEAKALARIEAFRRYPRNRKNQWILASARMMKKLGHRIKRFFSAIQGHDIVENSKWHEQGWKMAEVH